MPNHYVDYMKHLLALILFFTVFVMVLSCSDDEDQSPVNDSYYLRVQVQDLSFAYESDSIEIASFEVDECQATDKILYFANIGGIITSEYSISANLSHYRLESDFNENSNSTSSFIDSDLIYAPDACFNNYDFFVDIIQTNGNWQLDESLSSSNIITNIEYIGSENMPAYYAISGNFSAWYTDTEGSSVLVTGEYRFVTFVDRE